MENMKTYPRINGARLWNSLTELGAIGALSNGGVCRLALTDADKKGRDRFIGWCREIGLEMRVDAIGNIFAKRVGDDPRRKSVATGSHLDTQPNGGRFDGAYGVMAGLEVMRTLREAGVRTAASLELVAWTNEEGTRFAPSMMGSMVFANLLPLEDALRVADADGIKVAEELERLGYTKRERQTNSIGSYFEAHIEQGPVLEAEGCSVGVVTGGQGQCWYDVEYDGFALHAGTTPMAIRRDALVGAAKAIGEVRETALRFGGYATVGNISVEPNSRNVIPAKVRFTVEIRHPDDRVRQEMDLAICSLVEACAKSQGLSFKLSKTLDQPATPFDTTCVEIVRKSAELERIRHIDIVSGAAHDAIALAKIVPTAMIFVPCKSGISHNELESATPEDLAAGCQVLLDSMLIRASGVGGCEHGDAPALSAKNGGLS